jgi:glycosyltransferase involved in cell wall biosynthesis
VLLEAMAQKGSHYGRDIAPVREMLPPGSAELVPPLDREALAQTLIRLVLDAGVRDELGARARQRAYDVYRWEKVACRIVEAYRRLERRPAELARVAG